MCVRERPIDCQPSVLAMLSWQEKPAIAMQHFLKTYQTHNVLPLHYVQPLCDSVCSIAEGVFGACKCGVDRANENGRWCFGCLLSRSCRKCFESNRVSNNSLIWTPHLTRIFTVPQRLPKHLHVRQQAHSQRLSTPEARTKGERLGERWRRSVASGCGWNRWIQA